MLKGKLEHSDSQTKLLHLIIGSIIAILLISIASVPFLSHDNANMQNIRVLQLIQSGILFVLLPLVLAYMWSHRPLSFLKLRTRTKPTPYILVVLLMFVAIPAINYLSFSNKSIELPAALSGIEKWMQLQEIKLEQITMQLLEVSTLFELAQNIFLIAILAGIGEELFFRGIVQQIIFKANYKILAIWVTAFIFSFIHFQFYGFIPRLLLGALFGYLMVWGNNLWLPILAHGVNNAIGVSYHYLKFNNFIHFDIEHIGTGKSSWLALVSCLICIAILWFLRRYFLVPKHPQSE